MIDRVLRENARAQTVRLDAFLRLLDHMLQICLEQHEPSIAHTLLLASVLKARQSGRAARLLSEEFMVDEIRAISRTLVEVTVNAAYLQHSGEGEVGRFLQFHPETLYEHAGMVRRGRTLVAHTGVLQKLKALVTSSSALAKANNADPAWTPRSLMERAQLSDAASDIPIMSLLVARVYPRGHAALHGTIGSIKGFAESITSHQPPRPEDALAPLAEALFSINLCLMTLCLYLNTYFQLGMDEEIEAASGAQSQTRPALRGL